MLSKIIYIKIKKRVDGLLLKKIIVGTQRKIPRIASNINNLVTYDLPSELFFQFSSLATNKVGITNPVPPIAVDIKLKIAVIKVLCFSFHQIAEIFEIELYKIGYAIAARIDPSIIKEKFVLISTRVHAPSSVRMDANIKAIFIFFPMAKLAGKLSKIPVVTKEREHKVINE